MTIQDQNDIDNLMRVGRVVADVRDAMLTLVESGITTKELDDIGSTLLEKAGAKSAPKLSYNFPGSTCISVNEEAAHGIPGSRILAAGDVVNIDVSAELNGYYADTGATTVVPPTNPTKTRLCHATRVALDSALLNAQAGMPISGIGKVIQSVAKKHRFKVIRNLAGHGLGRSLHEKPEGIVGFYDPNDHRKLCAGQVVAIEPFLSTRSTNVEEAEDGWTLVGHPSSLSAQYEHTIIVTTGKPIITTLSASA